MIIIFILVIVDGDNLIVFGGSGGIVLRQKGLLI